jgi:hypothetical protein
VGIEPACVIDAGALGELADVVQEGGQCDASGLFEKLHGVGVSWLRLEEFFAQRLERGAQSTSSSRVRAS